MTICDEGHAIEEDAPFCRECWMECSLCPRPIPEGATEPLCASCGATAKAMGEQQAAADRFNREHGQPGEIR